MAKKPSKSKAKRPPAGRKHRLAEPKKQAAAKAMRDKVSDTTWKRLFALRDTVREHDNTAKEHAAEIRDIKTKLEVAALSKADEKTLAHRKYTEEKGLRKNRATIKQATQDILNLIDNAEDGTLFEGELKDGAKASAAEPKGKKGRGDKKDENKLDGAPAGDEGGEAKKEDEDGEPHTAGRIPAEAAA